MNKEKRKEKTRNDLARVTTNGLNFHELLRPRDMPVLQLLGIMNVYVQYIITR